MRLAALWAGVLLALVIILPHGLNPTRTRPQRAYAHVVYPFAIRPWAVAEIDGKYRRAFASLVRELSGPAYPEGGVIGTLDHQVAMWWHAFRAGYAFVPDNFVTTISDAEIETRYLTFQRLVGADEAALRRFLNDPTTLALWLGFNKYQLSRAHAYAPLSDYGADQLAHMGELLDSWHLALPHSEEARLVRVFHELPEWSGTPRLDVVVLLEVDSERSLAPPPEHFELSFRNEMFRVYRRGDRARIDAASAGLDDGERDPRRE